jgi:peptidyl-prolyl cis-trans isomerase C
MHRLIIPVIITLFLLTSHSLRAQQNYIAKAGNKEITKTEFRNRYELSPRILGDDTENEDSLKLDFLYSLIAEKLWALEASDKGMANSEEFRFYFTPVEKALIRDAVFKTEISDKVDVTQAEISRGTSEYLKILQIKALASGDSSKIENLYTLLKSVGSIDSLQSIRPDISKLVSTSEIRFGELKNEEIENRLYKLKLNEFTKPVKNGNIWFIFELENILPNTSAVSENKLQEDVKNIIRNRKIRDLYEDFYKKYFGSFNLRADEHLFVKISATFYNVISSDLQSLKQDSVSEAYYLSEKDINKVKELLGSAFLNKNLFDTPYGQVKVYDFLSDLTIVDVKFDTIDRSAVSMVLANELKRFMQQETIYRLGVKMGLANSEYVKSQMDAWKDNILAQLYKNSFNQQINVNDAEVENYYNNDLPDSLKLTGLEVETITAPDLDHIKEILNLIDKGKSFEDIAAGFAAEDDIKTDTLSDYNQPESFGEYSEIISGLKTGEIYGPVKTGRGYSLVKMIGGSDIPDSTKKEMADIKKSIQQKLFNQKLNSLLTDKTIGLANKYGVVVNDAFLYTEKYSDLNMFVHKYLGFGGRIAAVPFTAPFYKWYYRWKTNSGINP